MSDKGQKRECQGCIGFSDEHTCDGYADFLAISEAKRDPTRDMIKSLNKDIDGLMELLRKEKADNERLRAAICKAKGLIGDVDGTMDAWLVLSEALKGVESNE